MSTEENEKTVNIGHLEVPEWQFQIYETESQKFLQSLREEAQDCKKNPISKRLIRAIHTLSGTTNTMGVDLVAKIGHPLEYWLTHLVDNHPDDILSPEHCALVDTTAQAIITMVEAIQNHQYPNFVYDELQEQLTTLMNEALQHASDPESEDTQKAENDLSALLVFENEESSDFGDLDLLLGDLGIPEVAAKPVQDSASTAENVETNATGANPATAKTTSASAAHDGDIAAVLTQLLPDDSIMDDVDETIKDIFLEEAVDIFESLPKTIEKWIASAGQDVEHTNLIKRAFHTLKGSARMAGYMRFGHLVHNIETALDTGFPGLHQEDLPEVVQLTCDGMAQEVEHLQNNRHASGFDQLRRYKGSGKSPTTLIIEVEPQEEQTLQEQVGTTELPVLKPFTRSEASELPLGFKELLAEKDAALDEDGEVGTLRVPTTKVDGLSTHLGKSGMVQLRIESSVDRVEQQISEMSMNLDRLRRLLKDVEIQSETQMKSRISDAQKEGVSFDPLEFDRFSRLQELTRMTAEAMNDINNSQAEMVRGLVDIQDSMAETSIIADDMQHSVMSVRTVPVSSVKRRLERLVRQVCRDANKEADFVLENEIDIDSGVLKKVTEPIEHLIRNSLAHGVEAPAIRIGLGKPEKGAVRLSVNMRGNDIVFRLSDDGAGINPEAVQRKAREKKMIGSDETITQERANTLIFDPGFSTAETLSTLAGRGVGMDVVQTIIAGLGGRINVHSDPGEGTVFELVVPSYMSVISMVPVRSNKVAYAIPATLIEDVVVVRDTLVLSAYETGELQYNDRRLPFYGLAEVGGQGRNEITRNNRILLVTDNNETVAVHIDSLEPDRNLVMKPLCRTIATLPGLMGSTVSGDGTPLLVINPVFLRSSVQRIEHTSDVQEVVVKGPKTNADVTVMVVDDSLTVRRITQKFLDREGFRCIVAKDGLDAIEKITEHGCPDLFLSDIEMPNMDGFQLVEHIRTAVSKTVPIIMISSRSIEKYEDHARSLGVNKSIGKPYQEPELLEAIQSLTGLIPA